LIGSVPGQDHSIKLQDLLSETEQLAAQSRKAGAHKLRHPVVLRIGNDTQQFLDPSAPDRSGNAEFGKVSANRVDHRGLLANQQMTRAMEYQPAVLLGLLVGTNRMLDRVTASQIASASAVSFFCRLT
jgi:hypothetical protein